jgi:plastocyanin
MMIRQQVREAEWNRLEWRLALGLLALLAIVLSGCLGAPATPTGVPEARVEMKNIAFVPKELTVQAGTTVVWTNDDPFQHTVTSGTRGNPTGLFDQTVDAGQTFSYTFQDPGTYPYFCRIHPGMDGTITVQ